MELGTTLKIQVKGTEVQLTSELIGMETGKYVIIQMPNMSTIGSTTGLLNKGNYITVRYVQKGSVFGFHSQIIGFSVNPFKLIFIDYPAKIENYDLRSNKRIDCFLPAKIRIEDTILDGSIVDLSKEGCLFIIATSKIGNDINLLHSNNEIGVKFQLPGREDELKFVSQAKNINKDDQKVKIGLWFKDVEDETLNMLSEFLKNAGV